MKLSRRQLRKIIQEETLQEYTSDSFSRADDPGREMLKRQHRELQNIQGSSDPVVGVLATLMEEIAHGTDLQQPERALSVLESLKKAIQGA